jgi:hypothetical protein
MHIRDYLATLDFVNEERARVGVSPLDHLPAGTPRDPRDCVVARALPGAIVVDGIEFGTTRRELPRAVRRFVREFDSNEQGDAAALVEGGTEDDKGCLVPT